MQILLLIDYDNLLAVHKSAGLLDAVTKALLAHPLPFAGAQGRCDVRVYGGWYEEQNLTPMAQRLSSDIQAVFPAVIRCHTAARQVCTLSVTCEMALSLLEEPAHHIMDTFRKKRTPRTLKCADPSTLGCKDPQCPLRVIPTLFKQERCPQPSCTITLSDILFRNEQKLIDTMLACDVIYAAGGRSDLIVMLTDDDDCLPALRTAVLRGTPVNRIHPRVNHKIVTFPAGGAQFVEKGF